jgi:hypothetical protein
MPKNKKARGKKVNVAVKAIMQITRMRVREAMNYALFSKNEINDVNVRRVVSRWLFRAKEAAGPPKNVCHDAEASFIVSSLSEEADVVATNAMTSIPIEHIIPPPKRIKQRMTACALEKKRVEDRKQKKHRSDTLKEAVSLYVQEKAKPDGLSLRQVQAKMKKKYLVDIHYSTISRYANEGLVGASPKKLGPPGHLSKGNYKLLCAALSSFIPVVSIGRRFKTSIFGLMAGNAFWLLTVLEQSTRRASWSLRTLQHRVSSIWMKRASRSTGAMEIEEDD